MKYNIFILFICLAFISCQPKYQSRTVPWSIEQANQWQKQYGWLRGSNFQPNTAINQLEMWQAETFDPVTIDRELGWASAIGMNCMRVYLHHLAWEIDRDGFIKRMKQYLDIAGSHNISTIFVFFDDCWNETYSAGKQPEPKPGIHNSGWVQDPGKLIFDNPELIVTLEKYMKDVLNTFRNDKHIALWDLYNEPGNSSYGEKSIELLTKSFEWARDVNPSQPLTVGVWNADLVSLNKLTLDNSDIISYHNYNNLEDHIQAIDTLKRYGRPMVCTEYMARHFNSTFQEIMPMLKDENIGAINWGFVAGKTNTIFKWSEPLPDLEEPPLWFHDIFYRNGKPYSQEEVDVIRSLGNLKNTAVYNNSAGLVQGCADPYILENDGTYYLYGTGGRKGIKVYTSTDLANWSGAVGVSDGFALDSVDVWGSYGFWAPEVYKINNKFYMYFTVQERIAVAESDSPLGPFVQQDKKPFHLDIPEIDTHLFTDDDGKKYLYFVRFTKGNEIWVAELNDDLQSIKEETVTHCIGSSQPWEDSSREPYPHAQVNEGPFILKHKGLYYLTYSANHTANPDYGVGYATSKSPMGPWTKYDGNPILTSDRERINGPGHHSFAKSPSGKLYMVYHTHFDMNRMGSRKLAIDPCEFVTSKTGGADILKVYGPSSGPQTVK